MKIFVVRRVLGAAGLLTVLSPHSASAQRLAPSAMVRPVATLSSVRSLSMAAVKPQARMYVATGAVLGMFATAAGLAIYAENQPNDSLTPYVPYGPVVLAGGVLGGAIGFVVYRVRY